MDSRRARRGETEAMDNSGQDNARYAKVTSDGKKGHKEGARGQAEARGGEGGERGREGARGGGAGGERGARGARGGEKGARGGRENTVVTSVVVVNHSIESGGSDINCAQARHQKGRRHVRRTRNRTLDVTECHACHTKVHGSQRDRWTRGGREGARQRPWIGEGRTTPATLK